MSVKEPWDDTSVDLPSYSPQCMGPEGSIYIMTAECSMNCSIKEAVCCLLSEGQKKHTAVFWDGKGL